MFEGRGREGLVLPFQWVGADDTDGPVEHLILVQRPLRELQIGHFDEEYFSRICSRRRRTINAGHLGFRIRCGERGRQDASSSDIVAGPIDQNDLRGGINRELAE